MGGRVQCACITQNDNLPRKQGELQITLRMKYPESAQFKTESRCPLPFMLLFEGLQEKTGLLQMHQGTDVAILFLYFSHWKA